MLKTLAYALLLIVVLLSVGLAAVWLYLRTPDRPAAELERRYAGADDHFIELPGGLRLHYRDQGDRLRPVLVLLHGYGDSYATWEAWGQALQDRYRVISLDLPGHGLSAAPAATPPASLTCTQAPKSPAGRRMPQTGRSTATP
ncbi:MAG: alpha/beta fold hydrolase [Aquincola sp.]|nr:alpha/beta fold hydrolase [Aquincola sp.]